MQPKFRIGDKVRLVENPEAPYPTDMFDKVLKITNINGEAAYGSDNVYFIYYFDEYPYANEEDLEKVRTCKLNRRGL